MDKQQKLSQKKIDNQQFQRYLQQNFQGNYQENQKKSQITNTQDNLSSCQELTISWQLIEQQKEKIIKQMKNIVVLRQGYLEKQTGNLLNNWQLCYCILTSHKLYCYEDQKRLKLICCINFRFYQYKINKKQLEITLSCNIFEESINLKAYTTNQIQAWFKDLHHVIDSFDKFQKLKFVQDKKEIYQEKDALTQAQFLAFAQTGDIILMSTKAKGMLQRVVTNSDYDHIAIVIKFANGVVKLFQSNPDEGVALYQWPKYQKIFHHYQQMSVRKLYFKDRQAYQQPLLKFVKQNIGKIYDLHLLKLMRTTSQQNNVKKGYFCSQLVAKIYKLFGILGNQIPSSKYWPIDFTQKGSLSLLKQSSLSQQREIILNRHLKN